MQLTVYVTQEDIDKGSRCNASTCPVARALKRATNGQPVYVGRFKIGLKGRGLFYDGKVDTPKAVLKFIKKFDSKAAVEPFKFTIRGWPDNQPA